MTCPLQVALADALAAMRRAEYAGTTRALAHAILAAERALADASPSEPGGED